MPDFFFIFGGVKYLTLVQRIIPCFVSKSFSKNHPWGTSEQTAPTRRVHPLLNSSAETTKGTSKSFMDTNARLIPSLGPNSPVIPTQGITTSTLIRKMESHCRTLTSAQDQASFSCKTLLPIATAEIFTVKITQQNAYSMKCLQHDVLRSSFPLKINPKITIWV